MRRRHAALFALALFACGSPSPSVGGDGEACRPDGSCDEGFACKLDLCVAVVPGTEGEACRPDGSCDEGLVCQGDVCVVEPEPAPLVDPIRQVLAPLPPKLDLLFVVDNSGSMREEQTSLAINSHRIVSEFETHHGAMPDLHVGFVSSDMGAGPFGIQGCNGLGDQGALQAVPANADCQAPAGNFIIDAPGAMGERSTNYEGSFYDVFQCIAPLGTTGCGFEHTLLSMQTALDGSNSANDGFLRDDATLAIFVLSDEDDCSASDVALFSTDPGFDNLDSELGFFSSYRCFERGVVCDEAQLSFQDDRRLEGPRTNCRPREDSDYILPVRGFVDFLAGLKSEPHHVIYQAVGGVGPVSTGLIEGEPNLEPACVSTSGEADPAVRLDAVARQLGMGDTQTICNDDLSDALLYFLGDINARMSGVCLVESSDHDRCEFADTANLGTDEEEPLQVLPRCADEEDGPCVELIPDSDACPTGSRIEVAVNRRGTEAPEGTQVVALCPR